MKILTNTFFRKFIAISMIHANNFMRHLWLYKWLIFACSLNGD